MQADFRERKNRMFYKTSGLVRITGLEPAPRERHEPESCASANSAISAYCTIFFYYITTISKNQVLFLNFLKYFRKTVNNE